MRKPIAILVILIGFTIVVYPFGADLYAKHQQQKLIDSYIESRDHLSFVVDGLVDDFFEPTEKKDKITSVIGTINIPKINVNQLPLLYGATVSNLDKSAAMIKETSFPWEGGNTAIAGHRGRAAWLHFNRLNEVEQGDEIILEIKGETFIYEVYDTFLVLPHEVDVLEDIPGETTVTLITCDPPMANASHRLIIRGRLQHP